MKPESCILKHEYSMLMQTLSMKANKRVGQSKSTAVFVISICPGTNISIATDSCFKVSNANSSYASTNY
jgi:hypothetical protein